MKILVARLTAPVLLAAAVTACSGGGDTSTEDAATSAPTASGTADGAAGDATEEPGSEPGDAATNNAPGAGTEYCQLLGTDFAALFSAIRGPDDVTAAVDFIKRISDKAPPAVEDEWGVMESALGEMESALRKAARLQQQVEAGQVSRKRLERQSAQLMEDMQALNTPENNQAGETVAKHASEHCGLDLGQPE